MSVGDKTAGSPVEAPDFNKTYGMLGAAVDLMVWLYWIGFIMLLGAELNTELAKESRAGKFQQKEFRLRRRTDQAA